MNTGTYISGAAHVALIGWVLIGDVFRSEPPEPTITDVSVLSEQAFQDLFTEPVGPEVAVDTAEMTTPQAEDSLGEVAVPVIDVAPELAERIDPAQPDQDSQPDVSGVQLILPTEVADTAPTMAMPSLDSGPDIQIDDSPTPKPRAAPRVAPVPFMRPETDVAIDQAVTEAAAEPTPEAEVVEEADEQDAAPEDATTEIVTEAEEPAGAPTSVPVPQLRPRQPAPASPPAASPSALSSALSEALDSSPTPPAAPEQPIPMGPPLTLAETEALRVAVSGCWNTGSLSSAALRTTVIVGVQMSEDGKPISGSIRMISSEGGQGDAVTQAYEAARRAILRCGVKGYDLPQEKYGQWRDIEMTFNPEKMRIK